jgi:WD40 repeat protein
MGFFVTGGTMRPDAPSYVERQADRQLYQALLDGEFCYVLTSRQMGKSSLMVRTANRLRAVGVQVVVLDLTAIGQNVSPDQWYHGLLVRVGEELGLEDELDAWWDENSHLGPCQRLFSALRHVVLEAPCKDPKPRTPQWAVDDGGRQRLVIFVDEIDVVRSVSFATDEFFAAIRECYNRRTEDLQLRRISFCLLGVAMPSDLIRDTRLTPFNIGRRIELTDFTAEEAATLGSGLQSEQQSRAHTIRLLKRVLFWTGGHPYLTQRLCETLSGREKLKLSSVDTVCAELFLTPRASERDDNLIFVRERLLRGNGDLVGLLGLYQRVLRGKRVPDEGTNVHVSTLRLSGIVRGDRGRLVERNLIYEQVFDADWVNSHMPDAEVRRQRAAFYRGVIRTTGIAAIVVAFMIAAVVYAVGQANRARQALGESYFSQAQAMRVSGLEGQRDEALAALIEAHRCHLSGPRLRDEVISSLALFDVKAVTNRFGDLAQSNIWEISFDQNVVAAANADGRIILGGLAEGKVIGVLPAIGLSVTRIRLSPYGPFLAAEYRRDPIKHTTIWDWEKGLKMFTIPHALHAEAIDFSSDNRRLAIGNTSGHITNYSLPDGKLLGELPLKLASGAPRIPQVLRFNPKGDLIAEACLEDGEVQVWDLASGKRVTSFYHPAAVSEIAWHRRGELLATACQDNCAYLWNTNRSDEALRRFVGHEGGVVSVAFNRRGTLLATLGLDETLRLWNPATERHVRSDLLGESFERLQFSLRDDLLVASRTNALGARAWQVLGDEYMPLEIRRGLVDWLRNIDFSPDGSLLTAVTSERSTIWECASGREMTVLSIPYVASGWFSADSKHLFVSSGTGLLKCRVRGQPGCESAPVEALGGVPDELGVMAMSPDRSVASLVEHERILEIPVEHLKESGIATYSLPVYYRYLLAHPEGAWLAAMTGGSDSLHLWSRHALSSGSQPVIIPSTRYFSFSPDGRWLATCWSNEFQFYQVGEWQQPAFSVPRQPPSNQHAPIAFAVQPGIVALAVSRYTVNLIRLTSQGHHEVIASLKSPDRSPLEMLAFSPDGGRLAAATDKFVQLWDLAALYRQLSPMGLAENWPDYPSTPN